jgi:2-amino-4-hydroxy-6-hydroxymethyldihydropteridine diphosphokinase
MATAYICLGSNLGDKRALLAAAVTKLNAAPGIRVVRRSADYSTPPWGVLDQDFFVNACAELETQLSPTDLLRACGNVETELGRQRQRKWGPRLIDIDLLDYDGIAVDTPELVLPHPFMLQRAFVLMPLAEIAPELRIGGTSVKEALAKCDAAGIWRLD